MIRLSEETKKEILRLYIEDGLSSRKVGKIFNLSQPYISKFLRKNGIKNRPRISDEIKNFIKVNYSKVGAKECERALKISKSSIIALANKMGLYAPSLSYTEKEKDFLIKNYSNYGVSFCANHLNIKKTRVMDIARSLSITINDKLYLDLDSLNVLKNNFQKDGIPRCSETLQQSQTLLRKILKQEGIEMDKTIKTTLIKLEDFFNITKPEVTYFLGLLWADGHLKPNTLTSLTLNYRDFDNLLPIIENIQINNTKTSYYTPKNNDGCSRERVGVLNIRNKILCKFLSDNDYLVKSGASPDKILPKIPEHLWYYWWRGYLDGDGCIFSGDSYTVQFSSVIHQDWIFCNKLCNYLKINTFRSISHERIKNEKIHKSSDFLIRTKAGLTKFCEYIYQDFEINPIGLFRKYDRFIRALCRMQVS